jgi:hypothetical protein
MSTLILGEGGQGKGVKRDRGHSRRRHRDRTGQGPSSALERPDGPV